MKRWKSLVIVTVVVVLGLLIWRSGIMDGLIGVPSGGGDDLGGKASDRVDAGETKGSGKSAKISKDPRLSKFFSTLTTEQNVVTAEQISAYLGKVGRNGKSLGIAYLLTKDRVYLEELRKYEDRPEALAVLAMYGGDAKQALADAKKLAELDPGNTEAHYLIAYREADSGNPDAAMASLEKVLASGENLRSDTPENISKLVEALEVMDYGKVEAYGYLWTHPILAKSSNTVTLTLVKSILGPAGESKVSEEKRVEYAGKLLQLVQDSSTGARMPYAMLTDILSENAVLRALPLDYEYGEQATVGSRKDEVKGIYQAEIRLEEEASFALQYADPATVDVFVEMVDREGWEKARKWLLEKKNSKAN